MLHATQYAWMRKMRVSKTDIFSATPNTGNAQYLNNVTSSLSLVVAHNCDIL
jgi:hypothetical protein